jgi:hypothetical protein
MALRAPERPLTAFSLLTLSQPIGWTVNGMVNEFDRVFPRPYKYRRRFIFGVPQPINPIAFRQFLRQNRLISARMHLWGYSVEMHGPRPIKTAKEWAHKIRKQYREQGIWV